MKAGAPNIRYEIFRNAPAGRVTAALIAEREGVLSGLKRASISMESLGLGFSSGLSDGGSVKEGQEIAIPGVERLFFGRRYQGCEMGHGHHLRT